MAELDPRQQAAVDAGPGDVFVAAGAGSGKTRMLTARFVSAVLGREPYPVCDPRSLLTVTFTEKAAAEVGERIREELSAQGAPAARDLGDAWIMTIHAMCSRILRQHAFDAGIDPRFSVLDDAATSALEAEAVEAATATFLESCEGAVGLFDAYGYEAVVTGALSIRASIRAMGLRAADLVTIGPAAALAKVSESAQVLAGIARDIAALGEGKTLEANAARAGAAAGTVRAALGSGATATILETLDAKGFRKAPAVDGLSELVDAAKEAIEHARRGAAQIEVAGFEDALRAFVEAIDAECTRRKAVRGALDFSDLELQTVRLLETCPRVAEEYRRRFAMIMVDEFQDTNALQARIVAALASGNLCTVGDENQSIYGFRHADVGVFRARGQAVTERCRLDVNYRTAPALLEVVNELFAHPALLGDAYASLCAPEDAADVSDSWGGRPRFQACFIDWSEPRGADPQEVEAAAVAERVSEFVAGGVEPGSIAVLMRALSGGRGAKVERALLARGIPAYLVSGGAFFDAPEVAEARALLRVVDNVRDDAALTVVLAGSLCAVSPGGLARIRAHANSLAETRGVPRREARLWDALSDDGLDVSEEDREAVGRVVGAITRARLRRGTVPLHEAVMEPVLDLEADLALFARGPAGARAWANLLKLARIAEEYELVAHGDIRGLLAHLEMRELHASSEQAATIDGEASAVRIMTIHAAKGLEFPVAVVAGLSGVRDVPAIASARIDGQAVLGMALPMRGERLPTLGSDLVRAAAREADEAEAVRLLYVACTRAEEALVVVARTDPSKEADDTPGGLVRRALGFACAGSLGHEREAGYLPVVELVSPGDLAGASGVEALPEEAALQRSARVPVAAAATAHRSPRRVSYTALATYGHCARKYFLTSIARLPAAPEQQSGGALAFGSAVHAALERATVPGADVTDAVRAAAEAGGLDGAGEERLERAVRAYLSSEVAGEVARAGRTMREAPIAVHVGGAVLSGAIDAIAWDGSRALIVDYKTGTAPLPEDEARERYELQGVCYALAAFAAGASAAQVVFAEVERGREVRFAYEAAEKPSLEERIAAIVARMGTGEYEPLSSYEAEYCETCPGLGGMCPVSRPRRGGAA